MYTQNTPLPRCIMLMYFALWLMDIHCRRLETHLWAVCNAYRKYDKKQLGCTYTIIAQCRLHDAVPKRIASIHAQERWYAWLNPLPWLVFTDSEAYFDCRKVLLFPVHSISTLVPPLICNKPPTYNEIPSPYCSVSELSQRTFFYTKWKQRSFLQDPWSFAVYLCNQLYLLNAILCPGQLQILASAASARLGTHKKDPGKCFGLKKMTIIWIVALLHTWHTLKKYTTCNHKNRSNKTFYLSEPIASAHSCLSVIQVNSPPYMFSSVRNEVNGHFAHIASRVGDINERNCNKLMLLVTYNTSCFYFRLQRLYWPYEEKKIFS